MHTVPPVSLRCMCNPTHSFYLRTSAPVRRRKVKLLYLTQNHLMAYDAPIGSFVVLPPHPTPLCRYTSSRVPTAATPIFTSHGFPKAQDGKQHPKDQPFPWQRKADERGAGGAGTCRVGRRHRSLVFHALSILTGSLVSGASGLYSARQGKADHQGNSGAGSVRGPQPVPTQGRGYPQPRRSPTQVGLTPLVGPTP